MKKTSKKRSASNNAAPLNTPTLFIDISIWSHRLRDALLAQKIPFIALPDRFPQNTPDVEWLQEAGRQGWIVITRDKHIRRRPNELHSFRTNNVTAFVLTAGDMSAEDTASLICRIYPKILGKVRGSKPPAMFSISQAGAITPIRL